MKPNLRTIFDLLAVPKKLGTPPLWSRGAGDSRHLWRIAVQPCGELRRKVSALDAIEITSVLARRAERATRLYRGADSR